MIDIKDATLLDLLPLSQVEKSEVKAFSYAFKKLTDKLLKYTEKVGVWYNLDNLPEDVCDLLALELDTQYYDTSLDIEAKRRLIKNTFIWYSRAGTPSAVEELIAAVFGEGRVIETDEPYIFDIETNAPFSDDLIYKLMAMMGKVKNQRSKLSGISTKSTLPRKQFFGQVVRGNPTTEISSTGNVNVQIGRKQYVGIATIGVPTTEIGLQRRL